jgi:hypothetical protein
MLILKDKICLDSISSRLLDATMKLGAYKRQIGGKSRWVIDFADNKELARKLQQLNQLGFLFVGEPAGWPPAEVFDRIREKEDIREKFMEVRWKGPGDWFVVER